MVVRIRLARHGRRNLPYYHIVVANARTARNSKPLEQIGTFNPIPNENGQKAINLNFERAKYWLTVGAQPSEMVEKILVQVKKNKNKNKKRTSPLSSISSFINRLLSIHFDNNRLNLYLKLPNHGWKKLPSVSNNKHRNEG